jgi:hypothetical protein
MVWDCHAELRTDGYLEVLKKADGAPPQTVRLYDKAVQQR